MHNVETGDWTTGPSLRGIPTASCTFAADGTLWLLTQAPDGQAHIEVFARGGHCAFLEDYALRSWVDRAVLAEIEREA